MIEIKSQIERKILNYFFINPQKSHYINELAVILEVDVGNLHRKLKELEAKKWLISEARGREKYYSLNKNYPLLKEIKKIFEAEYGLEEKFKEILKNIKGLDEAYIYGSFARGKMNEESDIDILLIGNHSFSEISGLIMPLEKSIGREINIIDMTEKEFRERKRKKDEFIADIFKNPVIKIK
ncbi:nucleotidyltransferase domain-containing protein [Candidatus Falkowbacteria bacterium]|nr:nucleotidyltransferase domain-containing protein [Candidatus Falkowbacteria bacterium]